MSYRYNPLSGKIEFVGISTADGTSLEATINEKVANLVDSAPTTLDTLNELAAALNNDPNFASSTATLIGTKADTTSLSAVATSGAYADLTGKPSLFDGDYTSLTNQPDLFDGDYDSLTNKPTLFDGDYDTLTNKPTLFDGDYDSLTNTPSIPAAQVQSDYNQSDSSAVDFIKNKPSLFDGDYDSLTNKPSLFDGDYGSLSNQPDLFDGDYDSLTNKPTLFDGDYDTLTNKPTLFDGDYTNLTNQPDLFDGDYDSLTNKPTIPTVPTDVSSFTNDSGYITGYTVTQSDVTDHQAALSITESQISDLGTYLVAADLSTYATQAYVGSQGFITGYTVTESDVTGHQAALSITESQISDLGSYLVSADLSGYATEAYVGAQGFITGYTVTESDVTGHQAALSITESQISDLGTYLVAADLSSYATQAYVGSQGFITGYTVTESDVTGHESALTITESQISDLGSYLVSADLSTYALKTYVDTQVAGVVDSAPETLNTLNELSTALGNDPDFATSTANLIGTKANSADLSTVATSGAYSDLSGTPTNLNQFTNGPGFISDYTVTQSDVTGHQAALSITESQISDLQSYLTSVSESAVTAHQAALSITESQISDLGTYLVAADLNGYATETYVGAQGFITGYTVTESDVTGHQEALSITESQISDLGSYLVASDLSTYATQAYVGSQGFITDYTVTQSDVTDHQAALSITESQISDLGTYLVAADLNGYATETYVGSQGFITGYTVTESDVTGHQAALSITESQISDLGTYATLSDISVSTGSPSGSGSLNYTDSTGVLTFAPADLSSYLVASDLSTYALKTYVDSQVAGVVSSAPETLDTLNELAAALGDDPNFATTVSNQIGTKAAVGDFSVSTVAASGAGSLNYNDAGAFTFAPADLSSFLTSVAFADLTSKPTTIAGYGITDAFDGDYNSLTNQPVIPEGADLTGYATETYVNSQGFITGISFANVSAKPTTIAGYGITDAFSGAYGDLTGAPTLFDGAYSSLTGSPTNLSDFANDTNFITLAGVSVSTGSASGSGSLNYDNSTGVFSFAPADLSSFLTSASLSAYATETYVDTQVANVVSSAPETLNTLNELADALGDDPNFATTVSTQIGTKAALTDISVSTVAASGSGSLNYDNSTGTFSFAPPELSSYLTSYSETDPIFTSHVASGITPIHISNWNTAYAYGDHSAAGYLTASSVTDKIELDDISVSTVSAAGSGSLNYTNSTGVFTFAPADLSSYLELTSAPSTSKGSPGDAAGDVAMDNDYIYRCIANYTDGNADIWKRVAFSTDTW